MRTMRATCLGLAVAAIILAPALVAQAAPDLAGSVAIIEPLGFPGICDQPCYTVTKNFEVYFGGNATNPLGVQPAGITTYIYKLTHTGGTGTPLGFIPALTGFEIAMDTSRALSAGAIAGPGVAPFPDPAVANIEALTVRWQFQDIANPGVTPGILAPGTGPAGSSMSQQLFITSDLLPGTVGDNAISVDGTLSLDAPGTCVGPFVEPQVDEGEAMPCTIGFWKNRSVGKKGTTQWFVDPEFDQVVTAAVALCSPVWADEAALLADLQSKGKRSILIRARQQFAAFCLNMAAGDLFPDNMKCKLFDGNFIVDNACGMNLTVGAAFTQVLSDIQSGDNALEHDAHDCSDDVNNGISLFDSPPLP